MVSKEHQNGEFNCSTINDNADADGFKYYETDGNNNNVVKAVGDDDSNATSYALVPEGVCFQMEKRSYVILFIAV